MKNQYAVHNFDNIGKLICLSYAMSLIIVFDNTMAKSHARSFFFLLLGFYF